MHIRKRLFTEKLVRYRLPREEVMAFGLPELAQPHQCSLWGCTATLGLPSVCSHSCNISRSQFMT